MTTNRNQNRENKETGRNMYLINHNGNNSAEVDGRVFGDAEFDLTETHLSRIQNLEIETKDVVLVAIPMRESTWLEVIDACINAGTDFIMIDPVAEAASLAETIEREKVTVVATTPRVWGHIYRQLNTHSSEIKSLRIIRYNDRGEPEFPVLLIPAVLNK